LNEAQYTYAIDPLNPSTAVTLSLSLSAACAALIRLTAREQRDSSLRLKLIADIASIVGYGLFDMSYEGDYMTFKADDEPEPEAARAEKEGALQRIKE
jgi:hypothetical protein